MKYFDYAKNHTNVAQAVAVARVRREAIEDHTAWRVEAGWPGQERFFWNGGQRDCQELASDLHFNNAEHVILTNAAGEKVTL